MILRSRADIETLNMPKKYARKPILHSQLYTIGNQSRSRSTSDRVTIPNVKGVHNLNVTHSGNRATLQSKVVVVVGEGLTKYLAAEHSSLNSSGISHWLTGCHNGLPPKSMRLCVTLNVFG